jgi:hypothetical protein
MVQALNMWSNGHNRGEHETLIDTVRSMRIEVQSYKEWIRLKEEGRR